MIRIGLLGGRGYVGEELLHLLASIPDYRVVYVGSRGLAGGHVSETFSGLDLDLEFADLSQSSINNCPADAWVIAQDNSQSGPFVDILSSAKTRIIDISADHRFTDSWVYGLPEKNHEPIRSASRLANPGCYATAAQIGLLPLIEDIHAIPVAFGISGYSGAGRKPSDKNNPDRLRDNILPYALVGHTHEREVSRQLEVPVRLMPHVGDFFRGISITLHVQLDKPADPVELFDRYRSFYQPHPLVEVTNRIPEIRQVAETNQAMVGGFSVDPRDETRIAIISVLDNLRKGAASQVIQNLNLMFGFDSEHGLRAASRFED